MASIAVPLIGAGIGALGSLAGGAMSRQKNKPTEIQDRQKQLIDRLLSSINGNGPFSDMFNMDEASFQKSFVDPMKQKFESQIAPQIQQSYIQSGQQRGTGLDDTLTRAGVDMDSLLNQQYGQMQESAMNRKGNMMNSILGAGAGPQQPQSMGEAAGQGLTGFLSGPGFGNMLNTAGSNYASQQNQNQKPEAVERAGFVPNKQPWDYNAIINQYPKY